jgi:hypothetical protein
VNLNVVTTLGHLPLPQISVSPTTNVPSGSSGDPDISADDEKGALK